MKRRGCFRHRAHTRDPDGKSVSENARFHGRNGSRIACAISICSNKATGDIAGHSGCESAGRQEGSSAPVPEKLPYAADCRVATFGESRDWKTARDGRTREAHSAPGDRFPERGSAGCRKPRTAARCISMRTGRAPKHQDIPEPLWHVTRRGALLAVTSAGPPNSTAGVACRVDVRARMPDRGERAGSRHMFHCSTIR